MNYVEFAVPTAVAMKAAVLCVITPYSSEKSRRFAGNITSIFRAEKLIKQETVEAGCKLSSPEDGSDLSSQYTALQLLLVWAA
jgi:hypothetical protein